MTAGIDLHFQCHGKKMVTRRNLACFISNQHIMQLLFICLYNCYCLQFLGLDQGSVSLTVPCIDTGSDTVKEQLVDIGEEIE